MEIGNCQEAFGALDVTSRAMQKAIGEWFSLYYRDTVEDGEDPCQRIAYTLVNKLVRSVFSEYAVKPDSDFAARVIGALDRQKETALQLTLVGGECYIKPWYDGKDFDFTLIPRNSMLIFARDAKGEPTDVGTMEKSTAKGCYYTLLERRTVDSKGYLTITNRLFSSYNPDTLGTQVSLKSHPDYQELADSYTFSVPVRSVGLIRLKTPMLGCVDGSMEGVSLYAAAAGLIHAIDRNEYLLHGEFERGQSRVFASCDLLRDGGLQDNLFVGLDEDPQNVGLTVFSPQLREVSFLNRKQEYLRNVECVIGLKRGLISDVNQQERTATEISASQSEHALTVLDFQLLWQRALEKTLNLCGILGRLYGMPGAGAAGFTVDWGNGVLYDEEKLWQSYLTMVDKGLLKPEIALGWRFNMAADTQQQQEIIRQRLMPERV